MSESSGGPVVHAIDPRLRALLVCPACHGGLDDRDAGLACRACGLIYPVEDGVPVLLEERAARLPEGGG